jgi:glyoxylase I family protein
MTASPIAIMGLDHIVLRITDKAAMIAFYRDVLGCSVEWDRPELGLTHVRLGAALLDLVTVDGRLGKIGGAAPGPEGRNLDHFCVAVRPFDEAAIRAHLPVMGWPWSRKARASAPRARAPRSMSAILKATRWS